MQSFFLTSVRPSSQVLLLVKLCIFSRIAPRITVEESMYIGIISAGTIHPRGNSTQKTGNARVVKRNYAFYTIYCLNAAECGMQHKFLRQSSNCEISVVNRAFRK